MRYTILNVDDYDAARYIRTHTVRGAGFNVLEAATGLEALRMASELQPQVMLLDVHLPDVGGLDVCRRIKAEPNTAAIQVLHVSAIAVTEALQAVALDGGSDGYLVEPVNPEILLGTIRSLTRQWQRQNDLRVALEELRQAKQQVKTLTGLLPICAGCKMIRKPDGSWQILESYLQAHSEAKFSHGMCPDCVQKWYKDELAE